MTAPQLSRSAFDRLQAEFDDLTTRGRIEVANKIERAREEGDLKENAGYHAAKDEQGHMEGRIRQLEHLLENAEIVDECHDLHGRLRRRFRRHGRALPDRQHGGARRRRRRDQPLVAARRWPSTARSTGDTITYDGPNGTLTVKVLAVEEA